MGKGRPCRVCSDLRREEIDAALAGGVDDCEVSRRFGIPRPSVQRHRVGHLLRAAQDRLTLLGRGRDREVERQQLAQAAAADEPPVEALVQASLGTRALLKKLGSIEERLERMSSRAEEGGSSTGVAALAGQQIRSLEFGARLAGNPNFRPPSAIPQADGRAVVSIEMVFNNAGKTETISLTGLPVIDGDKINPSVAEGELPKPPPKQKLQGSISGYWNFDKPEPPRDAADDDDAIDAGQ
jgi:hypothetical protein